MAQLIDSSVLIELERRGHDFEFLSQIVTQDVLAISAITASELPVGVLRSDIERRRRSRESFVEGLLGWLPILAFDERVARVHAEIWAQLAASGFLLGDHDWAIGATAVAHEYSVLTETVRDFERVPGLVVERPKW